MRVLGFYFDLLFGFFFPRCREWDNKETKGGADATLDNVKLNGVFADKYKRRGFISKRQFPQVTFFWTDYTGF